MADKKILHQDLELGAAGEDRSLKIYGPDGGVNEAAVTLKAPLSDLMVNPMTTAGDIIYGGASGAPTRLGIGTDGYVLTVASGAPAWVINAPMVYPGAGIALSTGSAWDTSITNNSSDWNTAYGWGNHVGLYYELVSGIVIDTVGIAINSDDAFYLGDPDSDGTWRIIRETADLTIERREGGSYVTKSKIMA